MSDKLIINLSKADVPHDKNSFDKIDAAGNKKVKQTYDNAPSEKMEVAHDDKLGKRESPGGDIAVRKSTQRRKTENSNGGASKEPNKLNGEHRGNGRQRAKSSTDMVIGLADALEAILRSDVKPTRHPSAGTGKSSLTSGCLLVAYSYFVMASGMNSRITFHIPCMGDNENKEMHYKGHFK